MPALRPLALLSTIALVVVALAVNGSTTPPPAVGARSDAGRPVSPRQLLGAEVKQSLAYWTPQRMAQAKPMRPPRPDRRKPRVAKNPDVGPRPMMAAAQGFSDAQEGRVARAAENQPTKTYPYPFTRRQVENKLFKVRPYAAVGRVFFTQGGKPYVCSGASVASKPRHVVLTAGHCLKDGKGVWSRNVVFVPSVQGNKTPYGSFPAQLLWVPQGWAQDEDHSFDVGAFHVKKNAKKQTLKQAVGALGFAYNQARIQHWDILAYPALAPFNGKRLQLCEAEHAIDDAATGLGADPMGVGCDFSPGSSGGPFILDLRRGSFINGIVSYGYEGLDLAIYTPYFDNAVNNLRCAAATGQAPPNDTVNYNQNCKLP
jgi:V8-like Glu-specific endopeptidase